MKPKKIYIFFSFTIILLLILLCFKTDYEDKTEIDYTDIETKKIVKVNKNSKVYEMNIEEYLIGVVGCEMPALFQEEALKAGAVAARTYLLNKIENNDNYIISSTTNDQCYNDENELKEKWRDNYNKYRGKIEEAVNETKGEFMTYNGEIIKAFYFSTSNGKTENVQNVFGVKLDYLVSVDSNYDKNTTQFNKTIEINKSDFFKKLNLPETNEIKITNIIKNETNRVDEITINNHKFKGTEIRTLLNLRSTDFEIKVEEEKIIINTKGYGHGVGMSQYGANELAKLGYSYEEILKHYYSGIELTK